jgi:hypothetical protein
LKGEEVVLGIPGDVVERGNTTPVKENNYIWI